MKRLRPVIEFYMQIYDDIFSWEGFGGRLRLASGTCRLRIFDLKKSKTKNTLVLRPIVVVVKDIPGQDVTVRSCAGHIATMVTAQFNIDPQRMLWVEYYPVSEYGKVKRRVISERFDSVDFTWYENRALEPKWRPLKPPMLDIVKSLLE